MNKFEAIKVSQLRYQLLRFRNEFIKWVIIISISLLIALFLKTLYYKKDVLIWTYTHEQEARFAKVAYENTEKLVIDAYKDKLAK